MNPRQMSGTVGANRSNKFRYRHAVYLQIGQDLGSLCHDV